MAYDEKFKTKILEMQKLYNYSYKQIGNLFLVHPKTIYTWKKNQEKNIKPKSRFKISFAELLEDIKKHPADSCASRGERFGFSSATVQRRIKKLKEKGLINTLQTKYELKLEDIKKDIKKHQKSTYMQRAKRLKTSRASIYRALKILKEEQI